MVEALKDRISRIKAVVADIDGVLTDGRIVYGDYGDELKFFDVQDGLGLVLLRDAGFKTVLVTSRKSRVNHKRARECRISRLYQKVGDKRKAFERVARKYQLAPSEICYIGDDLVDLPALSRAGFAVAVANAVPEVREAAHYVTERPGGRGAMREVADLLLKTQDKWQEAVRRFTA